jgi:hypothetical protein
VDGLRKDLHKPVRIRGLVDDPCSSVVIAPLDTLGWDGVDGEGRKDGVGEENGGQTHLFVQRTGIIFSQRTPRSRGLIPNLHNLLGRRWREPGWGGDGEAVQVANADLADGCFVFRSTHIIVEHVDQISLMKVAGVASVLSAVISAPSAFGVFLTQSAAAMGQLDGVLWEDVPAQLPAHRSRGEWGRL